MADEPRSRAEMMTLIYQRWDELQDLMGQLSDDQMDLALADGWSAKVHMGHIAGWERSLMALLRGEDRSAAVGLGDVPLEANADEEEFEAVNRALATKIVGMALGDVRADSERTHGDLMALLESMSEEDLMKPYSHYQPGGEYEGRPVFAWVNGNTWDHYAEHIGWLKAGLEA